jgi:hypothetical protein
MLGASIVASFVEGAQVATSVPPMINDRGFLTRECEARFPKTPDGQENLFMARERALREREAKANAKRKLTAPRTGFFGPSEQERLATQETNDKRKTEIHEIANRRKNEKNQNILDATGQFADDGRRRLKEKLEAEARFLNAPAESWAVFLSGDPEAWRRDQEERGLAPMRVADDSAAEE